MINQEENCRTRIVYLVLSFIIITILIVGRIQVKEHRKPLRGTFWNEGNLFNNSIFINQNSSHHHLDIIQIQNRALCCAENPGWFDGGTQALPDIYVCVLLKYHQRYTNTDSKYMATQLPWVAPKFGLIYKMYT